MATQAFNFTYGVTPTYQGGAGLTIDTTAADAAVTTALGVAAADHDSTPEITDIQTEIAALVAAPAVGDATFVFDNTVITSQNKLKAVLDAIFEQAKTGLVPV